jgi:DNA-binding NarL/FixJ family response regulator
MAAAMCRGLCGQEDIAMATGPEGSRPDCCCCDAPRLTRGEVNVLIAIASGMTSRQAAAALRLSKSTVDGHVEAMRQKAGVATRAALLVAVVAHGVIDVIGGQPRWTGRSCLPRDLRARDGA